MRVRRSGMERIERHPSVRRTGVVSGQGRPDDDYTCTGEPLRGIAEYDLSSKCGGPGYASGGPLSQRPDTSNDEEDDDDGQSVFLDAIRDVIGATAYWDAGYYGAGSGGNSEGKPGATAWKMRSGRCKSLRRRAPRSRSCASGGR